MASNNTTVVRATPNGPPPLIDLSDSYQQKAQQFLELMDGFPEIRLPNFGTGEAFKWFATEYLPPLISTKYYSCSTESLRTLKFQPLRDRTPEHEADVMTPERLFNRVIEVFKGALPSGYTLSPPPTFKDLQVSMIGNEVMGWRSALLGSPQAPGAGGFLQRLKEHNLDRFNLTSVTIPSLRSWLTDNAAVFAEVIPQLYRAHTDHLIEQHRVRECQGLVLEPWSIAQFVLNDVPVRLVFSPYEVFLGFSNNSEPKGDDWINGMASGDISLDFSEVGPKGAFTYVRIPHGCETLSPNHFPIAQGIQFGWIKDDFAIKKSGESASIQAAPAHILRGMIAE